jgi:iron complex outermembrane receptor protein
LIAAFGFSYSIPTWHLTLDWNTKWVSKQYMDNIEFSELPSFHYSSLGIKSEFKSKDRFHVEVSAVVNNLFNQRYANNGYAFAYQYGGNKTTERFFYPQAGRNFMLRLLLSV